MFEWYISKTKQNLKNAYRSFNIASPTYTTALDRNADDQILVCSEQGWPPITVFSVVRSN